VIGTSAAEEHAVETLGSALSGGDERATAFSSHLEGCLDRSFRLAAVILGSRDEAEDALGDAVLRAWEHASSVRDPARFEAWFSRIVINVCRDRLRQRGRRPSELVAEPPARGDPIADAVERDALRQALATLTPEHRAVVALHYLEGLTAEQIAVQLGTRLGTVKSRLHYGVAELRAAYDAAARGSGGAIR
jgi:RNA polymerase sigma-70 factor, ECF subfamily